MGARPGFEPGASRNILRILHHYNVTDQEVIQSNYSKQHS